MVYIVQSLVAELGAQGREADLEREHCFHSIGQGEWCCQGGASQSCFVCPQDAREFFRSSSFSSVEPLLEPVEDHLVRDFSLAVALWVRRGGVNAFYAELLAEVFKEVGIELSPVVRKQSSWDPKSCNDVFPHKVLRVMLGDGGQRFGSIHLVK